MTPCSKRLFFGLTACLVATACATPNYGADPEPDPLPAPRPAPRRDPVDPPAESPRRAEESPPPPASDGGAPQDGAAKALAAVGAYCKTAKDCIDGLACAWGACRKSCESSAAACDPGSTCLDVNDSSVTPAVTTHACSVPCDPRSPAATCGNNTCTRDFIGQTTITDCSAAWYGVRYDECFYDTDCSPGDACAEHPFTGELQCAKWCRVNNGAADQCPTGETCRALPAGRAPTIGIATMGVCQ
jgi:hypothetical protein